MRSLFAVLLLCSACALLQLVDSQRCDLKEAKKDRPFPDIEKEGIESYQMDVEYNVPDAKQTDYYTEYYDMLERRGRVDGHQAGKFRSYIYFTETWESWEIAGRSCNLTNITDTPVLMRDDMTEWMYMPAKNERRTFGPSAMFKYAKDTWDSPQRDAKMAYMGEAEGEVRGLKAQYWRRCDSDTSYVDYFFTLDEEEDPLDLGQKRIPLRVFFGGVRKGKEVALSIQQYEILNFQPFISPDVQPFELPKGKGCKRGGLLEPPARPDFSNNNLDFGAEVVYKKIDFSGDDIGYWSYYSTLQMAIDVESDHLAYYYSKWSSKKPEKEEDVPTVENPEYVIYDMKHGYAYKTNLGTGECQIIREKSFAPKYQLPNDAGEISLTDPSILFPNNELSFLSEGETRGLKVNIFEEVIEGYILNEAKGITIPKAIVTHSYLKKDEEIITNTYVEEALVQVQLLLTGRYEKVIEMITINFYGFSTQIRDKRDTFNVRRCFKNDDDYSWVTLGFNADNDVLNQIKDQIPSIKENILNSITARSELNPIRIPHILVDINEGVYVTMMIFGKPPVMLDYLEPEKGKTVTGSSEVEGVQDLQSCANECLETEDNCWGFSMCGAVCTFGVGSAKVGNKPGCNLYRRYNNDTFIPTRENMIEDLKSEIEEHLIKLVFPKKGSEGGMLQLDCTSIQVTEPGEDDEIFNILGNKVNPRMRVVKAGYKLKPASGQPIKNLGKLNFADCQRVCLDYRDCESISFCLKDSTCVVSKKYGEDLTDSMEEDNMCSVLTRKYIDNFNRSPGNILSTSAVEVSDADTEEKCARACLKASFKCLSFDHCQAGETPRCRMHTVHYPNSKTRESVQVKKYNCGHYYRKYSTEFSKNPNKRYVGSALVPISNMTLEECSKACMEYGKGTCYGFDFCQDGLMMATSCVLLDKEPGTLKSAYSEVCTNYLRSEAQFAPRPYSTGYAGGIGFLCFIIGLVVGALIVFVIAYIKVNSR